MLMIMTIVVICHECAGDPTSGNDNDSKAPKVPRRQKFALYVANVTPKATLREEQVELLARYKSISLQNVEYSLH